jgi:N-acetylmuramoyl-L-alanine amidase
MSPGGSHGPARGALWAAALACLAPLVAAPTQAGAALDPFPARDAARPPLVVLDPGHGGIDPGAVAVDGSLEKNLVLDMARELRHLLERTGRYRVALTRDSDAFVRLPERVARARARSGQLLLSLHADSVRAADRRGAAVYSLAAEAAPATAAADAAVLTPVGLELGRRATPDRSAALADLLADELGGVTAMLHRHRRPAGFAVLKAPDLPAVLVELGCLSNAEDARALGQAAHRAALAQAIRRALDRYFALPPS